MRLRSSSALVFALLILAPCLLIAQRVRWEPPGGSLALRQTSQLSLIFEDCEPAGAFSLPAIPHLTLGEGARGEQSSVNIVNGQVNRTRTVYFTYPVRPTEQATVRIPSFTVQTDQGPLRVPAATFEVGEATIGNSSVPLDTAANSRLTVGQGALWAGEVVPIDYVLSVANRYPANLASGPEWVSTPLIVEEWSKPEPGTALLNGENRNTVAYRNRGYVRQAGTYPLAPVNQLVNLRVPGSGFSIFQAFQAEQYTITSNAPTLVVRPLPTPAAAGFNGAVGDFELTSQVVPEQASVGEPVTWTLTLSGTGNWPDLPGLPSREVSRDFRVVQPQAQRVTAEGMLFEGTLTEDVVLIPTRPGTYRLGPFTWSYFDPNSGQYQTITTPATTVTVAAAASSSAAPGELPRGEADPARGTPASEEPSLRHAAPPVAPEAIPRDPLPDGADAPGVWRSSTVAGLSAALLLLVPLAWLGLAAGQALRSDPGRAARQAKKRLPHTLASLRTAAPEEQPVLIRQWQDDVATTWQLHHAAPSADDFASDPAWAALWTESERSLYGSAQPLPADWLARAEQLLTSRAAPRFPLRSVFRGGNLWPVVVVFSFLIGSARLPAQSASADYARGDFAAAEAQWRTQLNEHPTQWTVHHNLSLALAQQERWGEAAAHAVVAFLQQPSHPSVRWHYGYALSHAGYTPAGLEGFLRPEGVDRVAAWLSPAQWQRIIVAAAALLALAALLGLLRRYRRVPAWTRGPALALIVLAVLTAGAGVISVHRYGLAAETGAVLIWRQGTLRSLPTDAPTDQQSTTLAPGSLAVVDQAFLGWRRLRFANGQTGWVRQDDFVPLWTRP